jgi:hypothetical protein
MDLLAICPVGSQGSHWMNAQHCTTILAPGLVSCIHQLNRHWLHLWVLASIGDIMNKKIILVHKQLTKP